MAEIEYAKDYGYSPGCPLWLVWRGPNFEPAVHPTREAAESDAAALAASLPGNAILVLAQMASVSTSPNVIGQRFDPSRSPANPIHEFAEVEPPAGPFPAAEEEEQPL